MKIKTLDEVIKSFEWCIDDSHDDCDGCPYETGEATDCHVRNIDALQYLKAYLDDKDDLTALRAYWTEQQANPALTWDELQQMARKPVWIEWKNPRRIPRWWIIDLNEKPDPTDKLIAISTSGTRREWLYKPEQGDIWQAYRKERKEVNE